MLQEILPSGAYAATQETLEDLILQQHGGLLSFGFLFALYLATDGVHAMIKSFNQSDHTRESRHPLRIWLTAMLLVFILTLLLILSIGLIVFSEVMVQYAQQTGLLKDAVWIWLLQIGKWGITLGSVPYTHRRAHETKEKLECRLLLEKKKKKNKENRYKRINVSK